MWRNWGAAQEADISIAPTAKRREWRAVKTLAFSMGLCILAFGVVGIIAPSGLVWVAQQAVTSGAFYVIGAVRAALGLVLISVASASRAPMALRVLGWVILVVGITTVLMGLLAIEQAGSILKWWMQQGSGIARLTCLPVMALGGFVAWACAPDRRKA